MKRIYAIFLLLIFLSSGCGSMRQEIDPASLGEIDKKLVIIGFISPQDTVLAVKVNITRPVTDANHTKNYGIAPDATVILSSGNRSIQLHYNGKYEYFQADPKKFPIRSGETYRITAQNPAGLQASGTCTVPQPAKLQEVRLDSVEDSNHRKQYFVRYYWQDDSQTTNYYQTAGLFAYAKPCPSCKTDANAKPEARTVPVLFESAGQRNTLLTDQAQDGKRLESHRGLLNEAAATSSSADKLNFANLYEKATVKAALLNVDEAYYKYHQALELQKRADGNPFAEPVLLTNTIQGGLGCFAAYNQAFLTVTLK
ncbi:DUF4249 domain-containing protein [Larkinella insperata]|uniref:DUF4249 domain-containing protein n=1 Tax=Larkinella insperata TaxID=332158 RepID=A0ABW3QJ71_9BACT|nr:DUF4249 domain-containing protein [Larkinella insperata]